ncbi:MAG TPA: hypothetical protein VJB06_01045 [archaeon]|nr:hypothetical protein [archaeon]
MAACLWEKKEPDKNLAQIKSSVNLTDPVTIVKEDYNGGKTIAKRHEGDRTLIGVYDNSKIPGFLIHKRRGRDGKRVDVRKFMKETGYGIGEWDSRNFTDEQKEILGDIMTVDRIIEGKP